MFRSGRATVGRAYSRFIAATGVVPGAIICLVAIGIGADVLARQVGLGGIEWMFDVVEYGLLVLTMVGAAFVHRARRHVTIDVVAGNLPGPWKRRAAVLAAAVSSAICFVIAYAGVLATVDAMRSGALAYKSFTLAEWIPIALVVPAFLLVGVESLRHLLRYLRGGGVSAAARDPGL